MTPLVGIGVSFLLVHLLVKASDPYQVFFLFVIAGIGAYLWKQQRDHQSNKTTRVERYIDRIEKSQAGMEYVFPDLYKVYKGGKKLIHVREFPALMQWLYDMQVFEAYRPGIVQELAVLVEAFLAHHYKVMMDKYDATHVDILMDIRDQVVAVVSSLIYDIPKISLVIDLPDMDAFLHAQGRAIEAELTHLISITEKHMKRKTAHWIRRDVWPNGIALR